MSPGTMVQHNLLNNLTNCIKYWKEKKVMLMIKNKDSYILSLLDKHWFFYIMNQRVSKLQEERLNIEMCTESTSEAAMKK